MPGVVILIKKEKNKRNTLDNTRGIVLFHIEVKVLEKVLRKMLLVVVEVKIGQEQTCPILTSSIDENLYLIRYTIERVWCKSESIRR